jgi:dienelactone hydrolase
MNRITRPKTGRQEQVTIAADGEELNGDLYLPENSDAIVIFAHGSGSGRQSPRNRQVAWDLNEAGMGTLLFDLLSEREETIDVLTGEYRFNIDLLTGRLIGATVWVRANVPECRKAIGYFGASTGAAAALMAAAREPEGVGAVVSRGGRADMAEPRLPDVKAPTLLIVGGSDPEVIELNRRAYNRLGTDKELAIVPGAK